MSSAYTPWHLRLAHKYLRFLFVTCPEGNYHWKWDRLCFCRYGEHTENWHGGILDLKYHLEYQPCHFCEEEASHILPDHPPTQEDIKYYSEQMREALIGKKPE